MSHKVQKRHFSLMEVMIAFVLILFCLVPLLYPNMAMYREQSRFTDKIKIDHAVTLLYGDLVERLHRREISFDQLIQKNGGALAIPPESLLNAGINPKFPYEVTLTAKQIKMKGDTTGIYIVALLEFTYAFKEKKDKNPNLLEFTYKLPVVKLKPESQQESSEEPSKPPRKPAATNENGEKG